LGDFIEEGRPETRFQRHEERLEVLEKTPAVEEGFGKEVIQTSSRVSGRGKKQEEGDSIWSASGHHNRTYDQKRCSPLRMKTIFKDVLEWTLIFTWGNGKMVVFTGPERRGEIVVHELNKMIKHVPWEGEEGVQEYQQVEPFRRE